MAEEQFKDITAMLENTEAAEAKLEIDIRDNILELPDLGLAVEGIGNKIVVVLDRFKSGYECGVCAGTGRVRSTLVQDGTKTCPKCEGRGHIIFLPGQAQSIATTGVVVAIGPDVQKIRLGTRIIATPHSGVALPIKGNVGIKIYHEHEPLAYIHNIDKYGLIVEKMIKEGKIIELDTTKFVELDTPLPESQNI